MSYYKVYIIIKKIIDAMIAINKVKVASTTRPQNCAKKIGENKLSSLQDYEGARNFDFYVAHVYI